MLNEQCVNYRHYLVFFFIDNGMFNVINRRFLCVCAFVDLSKNLQIFIYCTHTHTQHLFINIYLSKKNEIKLLLVNTMAFFFLSSSQFDMKT